MKSQTLAACDAALRLACAALLSICLPASAADLVREARTIGAFKTVRLVGSADLVLTQADTPALTVEAQKDQLQNLKAEVRGDELVLRYETPRLHGFTMFWHQSEKGPRFLLSASTLERLATSGSGDVVAESWTAPGDFEISVAGSSDIRFATLAARKLVVRISGSGDVSLGGGVLEQSVRIAGSGDYHAKLLQSATAAVSIRGSGDATVWARDTLSINVAGSGDVKYYGRPTVSKSVAGSGSVNALGDKP